MDDLPTRTQDDCPTVEELLELLDGRVAYDRYEAMLYHVDACAGCQRQIEQVAVHDESGLGALYDGLPRPSSDGFSHYRTALESHPTGSKKEPNTFSAGRDADTEGDFSSEPECQALIARLKDVAFPSSQPRADTSAKTLSDRLGPYLLVDKIGEGGMGTVYKAIHTKLKRPVAIKVLGRGWLSSDRAVARFEREMEAIGRLDHPNIVRASDAGEFDGVHFLAMEYVEGPTLAQLVAQLGPLPPADACEIVRQAAEGLQYAHQQKLVHRDIKPSNLMLAVSGQRSAVSKEQSSSQSAILKVLDLGLALLRAECGDPQLTPSGLVMGTPDYSAPEQWEQSRRVDIRADIYSLGCTLFYLLAGRAPFDDGEHDSLSRKMRAHLEEPRPDILRFRQDVPPELASVVQKCLARTPDERFTTPSELAEALAPFCRETGLSDLFREHVSTSQPQRTSANRRPSPKDRPSRQMSNRQWTSGESSMPEQRPTGNRFPTHGPRIAQTARPSAAAESLGTMRAE